MAQKSIALRHWTIDRDDFLNELGQVDEAAFQQAVAYELSQIAWLGDRIGVGVAAAPVRRRMPGGAWYTAGWIFQPETVPAAGTTWEPASLELGEPEEPAAATVPGDPLGAGALAA